MSGVEKILNQKLEVKDLRTLESRIAGFDNSFDAMQKELAKINAKFSEVSKDDNSHSITWDYFDAKFNLGMPFMKYVLSALLVFAFAFLGAHVLASLYSLGVFFQAL